ncbi:MAG: bacillithiol biosynthesis BshC, partial [Rhodothermales bacterium]
LHEEGRVRLDPGEGSFRLRGLDSDLAVAEALDLLEREPGRFSANVALRPLAQDTLLPTAVYVAGPGEVAYFAQLKGLYDWAGIPMPIIYPRASATFVEKRIRRVLDRYDLDVPSLSGDAHEVIRKVVLAGFDVDLDSVFADVEKSLADEMDRLKPLIVDIDASLGKTVEATAAGMIKQIEQLKGRTIRSARRQEDQIGEAIQRAAAHLYPGGNLQERTVSPLYFMTKYGSDLPIRWISELSTDTTDHQVVEIAV